jgi:hypothetical protein
MDGPRIKLKCVVKAVEEHIRMCLLGCHHHPLPQQPSLRYYAVGNEVPLGRFVRTLLRQLVQELLKSGPEFPVLAEGQRLHPAQLVELPRAATAPPPVQPPRAPAFSSRSTACF